MKIKATMQNLLAEIKPKYIIKVNKGSIHMWVTDGCAPITKDMPMRIYTGGRGHYMLVTKQYLTSRTLGIDELLVYAD
jgi:hypothetical protein